MASIKEEKLGLLPEVATQPAPCARSQGWTWRARLTLTLIGALAWYNLFTAHKQHRIIKHGHHSSHSWGTFPRKDDPFHFLPCTNLTLPPDVSDTHPLQIWSSLYDSNPSHWSYGNSSGLYLCGYLDVPLDYTNGSDTRISRLAITKYQHAPKSTKRTLVVEPGGPGGSGTNLVWRKAERFAKTYTNDSYDVLGWDPRGVNASQPSIWCYAYDADRDRYSLLPSYLRSSPEPRHTMLQVDALNQATLEACRRKYDDIPLMLTTAFVARDLDQIRKALGEEVVNGYFVSYGTGIAQTYVNMFPDRVGRLMLDGTEYVRDQRLVGGFGWAALDNITAAFHDGFLGECVDAGPEHCDLAKPRKKGVALPTKKDLINIMDDLFSRLVHRPIPGYTNSSGPVLITYTQVIGLIYQALYTPSTWNGIATAFNDLLDGNTTLISRYLDSWSYDPSLPTPTRDVHTSGELDILVICSDQYDSPLPPGYSLGDNGEEWYLDLWQDMVRKSEIGGNARFYDILPCRQWNSTFPNPPRQVYRGDLNHTLSHPVLLIAESYDPATPLRNGRRLLAEMGDTNARLIAHHGYGHSSRDTSECTDKIMREYMLDGKLPEQSETACFADKKPYRYQNAKAKSAEMMVQEWHAEKVDIRGGTPVF